MNQTLCCNKTKLKSKANFTKPHQGMYKMLSEYHLLKKTNCLRNHVGFELDINSDMRNTSELQNQRLVLLAVRRVLITERFHNHSTGEMVSSYRPSRTGPYRIWFQFFKHVIALRGNDFKSQTPRGWTSGSERTDFTTICANEHTSVHLSLHSQKER